MPGMRLLKNLPRIFVPHDLCAVTLFTHKNAFPKMFVE